MEEDEQIGKSEEEEREGKLRLAENYSGARFKTYFSILRKERQWPRFIMRPFSVRDSSWSAMPSCMD